jgi:hypothetical protein
MTLLSNGVGDVLPQTTCGKIMLLLGWLSATLWLALVTTYFVISQQKFLAGILFNLSHTTFLGQNCSSHSSNNDKEKKSARRTVL